MAVPVYICCDLLQAGKEIIPFLATEITGAMNALCARTMLELIELLGRRYFRVA
jgi:hypothetical protein